MRMRYLVFTAIAAFLFSCKSSDKKKETRSDIEVFNSQDQFPQYKNKGKMLNQLQWKDKAGQNILVTYYIEPYDDKEKNEFDEDGKTAKISAMLLLRDNSGYSVEWDDTEVEKSCPFDITCEFVKDAITVTDLDNDGLAEITLVIRRACRSDV